MQPLVLNPATGPPVMVLAPDPIHYNGSVTRMFVNVVVPVFVTITITDRLPPKVCYQHRHLPEVLIIAMLLACYKLPLIVLEDYCRHPIDPLHG
jgi:hypothetical protein